MYDLDSKTERVYPFQGFRFALPSIPQHIRLEFGDF